MSCPTEQKEVKIDKNLANSLAAESEKKIATANAIKLNDITASSKLCLVYDALRGLLEATAIEKGFKLYNHECYCAFLKEILKETNMGDDFDKFKKTRNSINYYGKSLSIAEAEITIKGMLRLIERLKQLKDR